MDSELRVLCVFSSLDRGGSESMCMNLYRHIDRNKVQLDFVKHFSTEGAFEKEIQELGGRIFEAPRYRIWNHWQYCRWWEHFFQQHPEYKIIHGHFFTISPIYFKVAKKYGITTIAHSHCTKNTKPNVLTKIKWLILKNIDKVSDYKFACGRDAGEWLFPRGDFEVFPNAIDTEKFRFNPETRQHIRDAYGLGDRLVLGTVGRFDMQKNPFGIIEIVSHLAKVDRNVVLLWLGDGSLRYDIERCIEKKNLKEHVLLLGVQSNVHEFMQAMDVFIFPSFFEGFGIVALEAQAAGLPTLISEGLDKIVAVTDLCSFVKIDDYQAWVERILSFKDYPRQDMQQEIIKAGFEVRDTARKLQEFYIGCYKKYCDQK